MNQYLWVKYRKQRNLFIALWMVTILVMLMMGLIGCGGGHEWPQSLRDSVLNGCVSTGGPYDQCKCVVDGLEQTYTPQQMEEVKNQYLATGVYPESFLDVVRSCVN